MRPLVAAIECVAIWASENGVPEKRVRIDYDLLAAWAALRTPLVIALALTAGLESLVVQATMARGLMDAWLNEKIPAMKTAKSDSSHDFTSVR